MSALVYPIKTAIATASALRALQVGTNENIMMCIAMSEALKSFDAKNGNEKATDIGRLTGEICLGLIGDKGASLACRRVANEVEVIRTAIKQSPERLLERVKMV